MAYKHFAAVVDKIKPNGVYDLLEDTLSS